MCTCLSVGLSPVWTGPQEPRRAHRDAFSSLPFAGLGRLSCLAVVLALQAAGGAVRPGGAQRDRQGRRMTG